MQCRGVNPKGGLKPDPTHPDFSLILTNIIPPNKNIMHQFHSFLEIYKIRLTIKHKERDGLLLHMRSIHYHRPRNLTDVKGVNFLQD